MSHPIEQHCPKCGAEPGRSCVGNKHRERKAFHRERGSRRAIQSIEGHGLRVDSPLEAEMAAALAGWIGHHGQDDARLETQVKVGPYRADIVVTVGNSRLVVECDGETFHNSREAIARDKRRDRYFVIHGYALMRFTGDEIRKDVRGCAATVGLWIVARR